MEKRCILFIKCKTVYSSVFCLRIIGLSDPGASSELLILLLYCWNLETFQQTLKVYIQQLNLIVYSKKSRYIGGKKTLLHVLIFWNIKLEDAAYVFRCVYMYHYVCLITDHQDANNKLLDYGQFSGIKYLQVRF